jgi:hypothetical protein
MNPNAGGGTAARPPGRSTREPGDAANVRWRRVAPRSLLERWMYRRNMDVDAIVILGVAAVLALITAILAILSR